VSNKKVWFITGAGRGMGADLAKAALAVGHAVVATGRNSDAVSKILGQSSDLLAVRLDVTKRADAETAVGAAVGRFGGIDVLVNNAASTARGYLEDVPVERWDAIMHVNLRAPFLLLQEAVASMKARDGGSIVNIGSVNAYIGEPKLGPYSVSKGGLMTLTRNAAATLSRYRIRVNQINVGWTLTEGERNVKRLEGHGDEWLGEAIATRPFGRLLAPHDIAIAAAYFASDDSALVTGTVMDLEQYPVGAPPNW